MKKIFCATALMFSTVSTAAEMQLSVEIPAIDTAEYHRPYIAAWVENSDKKLAEHLLVWYQDGDKPNEDEGEEWLKDIRRWWRKGGRSAEMPIDGVSGATRPVGKHALTFATNSQVINNLKAGDYTLLVEAARENGGREVVKIPFSVPFNGEETLIANGESELGEIAVTLLPWCVVCGICLEFLVVIPVFVITQVVTA